MQYAEDFDWSLGLVQPMFAQYYQCKKQQSDQRQELGKCLELELKELVRVKFELRLTLRALAAWSNPWRKQSQLVDVAQLKAKGKHRLSFIISKFKKLMISA